MAEKKRFAIIDGKSVFYRGYYAMPNLATGDGRPTGGVYGFAVMALEVIKRLKPDYVAVAWDKPKTNIRKRLAMYPEYKAGRKPAPPDFYDQVEILHELLQAFGWPLYQMDDYEADDIMGALAMQASKKGIESMLITSDLDMLQLVDPHVHVYALKTGLSNIELYSPKSFEAKYGLKVEQFLDFKAIKGDSSDNVPGVPGIGEKTATELLKQYKTLDGVYENLALTRDSVRKKLEAGKESAYLSKKVCSIWTDAPIKLDLKEVDGSKCQPEKVLQLLQELEFKSLARQLPEVMQVAIAPVASRMGQVAWEKGKNIIIDSDAELAKIKFGQPDAIYIHTRSAGKHGQDPQVLILSTDAKMIYTLDLKKLSKKSLATCYSLLATSKLIGYDVKSSLKTLIALQVTEFPEIAHDVQIGAFLLNSLRREQTLTELAQGSLNYEGSSLENLSPDELMERAPEIVGLVKKLYDHQKKELAQYPKLAKLAADIEWPVIPVLARMEYAGIKLDTKYMKKVAAKLSDEISDIEQTIYGLADEEFNLNSPQQVSTVFFDKLKLPTAGIKKLPSGFLSTDVKTLTKLAGQHKLVDEFIKYREYAKLKNTYADSLPKTVGADGRIHTTFNMTVAPTGRLSSVDPNLQQIPTKTEVGRRIEKGFVAEAGHVFVGADYSQFELRLAAAIAGDQNMIEAFNHDADIHLQTAAQLYDIPEEKVTKPQRSSVKAVNFGIMYGLGPHALSDSTGMSFTEAREFINRYFEIRPKLKKYIEETRKFAEEKGYVETLLGRRRPTPDIKSSNFVVREGAYRAAINMPLQGSAADIMKLAMVKVQEKLDELYRHSRPDRAIDSEAAQARRESSKKEKKSNWIPSRAEDDAPRILLQIHDSLIVEAPKKDAKKVAKLLKETMEDAYTKLPVKLTVDTSIGENWGEL